VELHVKAREHYEELESQFVTFLDNGGAASVDLAVTKLLRLQQICSGVLKEDDVDDAHDIQCSKYSALEEFLESIGKEHKVIIWSNWRSTYDRIAEVCDSLKLEHVRIVGNQTAIHRQAAIDAFNRDPKVRVCIANQAAGGVGIGLQAASYAVYFSKSYNLEHDLQSEARNYRGGSEIHAKVTRIDLITEDTIEEDIDDALSGKKSLQELLLNFRQRRTQEQKAA
jgi:SNF2 family DNA or RNA helicase